MCSRLQLISYSLCSWSMTALIFFSDELVLVWKKTWPSIFLHESKIFQLTKDTHLTSNFSNLFKTKFAIGFQKWPKFEFSEETSASLKYLFLLLTAGKGRGSKTNWAKLSKSLHEVLSKHTNLDEILQWKIFALLSMRLSSKRRFLAGIFLWNTQRAFGVACDLCFADLFWV